MTRGLACCLVATAALASLVGCGSGTHVSTTGGMPVSASSTTETTATAASQAVPTLEEVMGRREVSARRAIADYYGSLNSQDYQAAWSRLSPQLQASMGGYDKWAAGFARTVSTSVSSIVANAHDSHHATVAVRVRSLDRDACGQRASQRFVGNWDLRLQGGHWQATAISMHRVSGGTPATDGSTCSDASAPLTAAVPDTNATPPHQAGPSTRVCYPGYTIPAVTIPAITIPAVTIPAITIGDQHYPAQHLPAQHLPAQHLPAQHFDGHCVEAPEAFAPPNTTVATDYPASVDPEYSGTLTDKYSSTAGSSIDIPDPTAPGFGELNGAGFPKNQYVHPYMRRDGTFVSGYWRNSPSDGLPTCHVITC